MLLAGLISVAGVLLLIVVRSSARQACERRPRSSPRPCRHLSSRRPNAANCSTRRSAQVNASATRLAAELHDGPIQALPRCAFASTASTSKLRRGETDSAGSLVVTVRDDSRRGSRVAAAHERTPAAGPRRGWPRRSNAGLRHRLWEPDGCCCSTAVDVAPEALSPEREVVVYRLVQEALTNVRRHARATFLSVKVSGTPDGVDLLIVDTGSASTWRRWRVTSA